MILTLLLDLDGTLLTNEIDSFIAVYIRALGKHMAHYVDPSFLGKTLLSATQAMLQNQQPDRTLQENFDSVFYPVLGLDREVVQPEIDRFYAEVFPTLKPYTQARPEAVTMVEEAFLRGFRIGIATNPLFPRTAIEQRIYWADLSLNRYPFALIPAYETFHFAKPNPAYFAEFLGLLGWPEGPVLMVGNEMETDVEGGCQAGIRTFLVTGNGKPAGSGPYPASANGSLADLLPWIDSKPPEFFQPTLTAPPSTLAVLRSTPAVLGSLANRLDPDQWQRRPEPGEWAPTEILHHLKDVDAEVNIPRLMKIIHETNPFLPGMDTDPWAEERKYIEQDGPKALKEFIQTRLELLALLDTVSPRDWQRPARHAIIGPTQLAEIVSIIANHDRLHIHQFHRDSY